MKILIVEDDTLLLQGLILAAQTEGYALMNPLMIFIKIIKLR